MSADAEPARCAVCADEAIPMRVVEPGDMDAMCEDGCGRLVPVAVELVTPVSIGDRVLVHAGVAIGRLDA